MISRRTIHHFASLQLATEKLNAGDETRHRSARSIGPAVIEYRADLACQRIDGERLGQERDAGVQRAVMDDGIAGVARGEQHLEIGPPFERAIGERPTAHFGHDNISK